MGTVLYLDHAATTPLAPEVHAAMEPYFAGGFGNPSSRHPLGVQAAEALDEARRRTARAVGGRPRDVVFTSGGTEANNLAVLGFARARRRRGAHVVLGPTEHASVAEAGHALAAEGFEVETARLDAGGALDLDDFARRLRPDTVLVAQMLVSNELGTIYPVARLARLVRRASPEAALHVDAVQAAGKLDLSLPELDADSIAVSGHKIRGPKGAGALVLKPGTRPPSPLVFGGGQEGGLRSGTENVAALVGLGAALELASDRAPETAAAMEAARTRLRERLARVGGVRPLEPGDRLAPSILAVRVPGAPAEVWQHHLEVRGVMTSVGSACQANKGGVSPAFAAAGLSEDDARRVLRLSLAADSGPLVDAAADAFEEVAAELAAEVG
ncbi:MAG: cysteine desulfurase family protein [Planctomycetota bacterium]